MVITDLKRICTRCEGSGHAPGFVEMGVSQINFHGRCPSCEGRGFELTELGRDVLDMLRPFVQEMIEEEKPKSIDLPSKEHLA